MEEHFFKERGIYYRTNDIRPERTTLVFIHGLSGNSAVWKGYEAAFKSEYNTLAVDLRGHGKSRKPGHYEDFEIEKIANDIAALLAYLAIGPYIPISHSLSTIVAVSLLQQRPGAVAAVFMSPLYGTQKIPLTRITRALTHFAARIAGMFSYSDTVGGHTDYARVGRAWDWSAKLMVREIPNTTLHVYLFSLAQLYARDYDAWWESVRIPALIIHGRRDTISPFSKGEELAKKLPNATLVEMPQGNHVSPLPCNDAPEIERIIASYLKKVAPERL